MVTMTETERETMKALTMVTLVATVTAMSSPKAAESESLTTMVWFQFHHPAVVMRMRRKNNNCQPRNEQIEQTCKLTTNNEQQSSNNEWTSESQLNGVCV